MISNSFTRRSFLLFAFSLFVFFSLAYPQPAQRDGEIKKLPPVNWIRSRTIDIKHLDIDLKFDWDKEQAIGSTVVTYTPFADSDTLVLDATAMTIDTVTLVGGGPLKFKYDGRKDNDNLEINIGRTVRPGEDIKVRIDYKTNYVNKAEGDTAIGNFGRGLRFIKPTPENPLKPRQIWSQGETEFNRYWFPSYDSPNDFRTTDLRATVAKPFYVVSNGKLVETRDNPDNTRTFYWKMEQPFSNYLTSIVVSETTPVVQDFDGIPVHNYGYTNETKEVAATVKNLPATMKFFSEITGIKYPYPKYSQAFVEDFGGGMENISATTQIREMIRDERELLDTDSEGLQSHELAHQWFGDYVTCRDWGQIWLNESFATYMQAMWTEKLKGRDEFLYMDVRGNQNNTLGTWNSGNRRPIVTKNYADKDAMFDTYAYPGGAAVLHMLRKHLGDALFYKSLNHYLRSNAHQPVSTEDLRIAIEEATGQSMDWFFDQWLYKMGHPVFEISQAFDDSKKQLTIVARQAQKLDLANEYPQTDFFQSFVDIEIDNKIERVWIKPQEVNTFTFSIPASPKLVNFDYEGTLLKEMKFEKSTDDLLYQLANDKDPIGRRWAMAELEKRTDTDKGRVVAALITSAEKDHFWRIRRAALSVIANIYSPDPPPGQARPAAKLDPNVESSLIRLTRDPQSLIRADSIELLGETQDKKYSQYALPMLEDRSYTVIDEASLALARMKEPRAFDPLMKLAATTSWKGRIQIAAYNALAELADKRAFDNAYAAVTNKNLPLDVRTAALTVIGATGKGDPRAFPIIFEKFKGAVQSNNFGPIYNGVQAVIKLADPRGQQAFELLKEHFKGQQGPLGTISRWEAEFKEAIKK